MLICLLVSSDDCLVEPPGNLVVLMPPYRQVALLELTDH